MTQKNFFKLFTGIGKSFRKSLWVMTRFWVKNKYSWNWPGNSFRKIPCLMTQNYKIWKQSGKSFRDIPCVTARSLEIVSGICLNGLNELGKLSLKLERVKVMLVTSWCKWLKSNVVDDLWCCRRFMDVGDQNGQNDQNGRFLAKKPV